MKRNEILNAINDLYDEKEQLKQENYELRRLAEEYNKPKMCTDTVEYKTALDRKMIEYARIKLFEQCTCAYRDNVRVRRKENGELSYTEFNDWAMDQIQNNDIPKDFSKQEIFEIIYEPLNLKYQNALEEQIKEFKENENNEK